MLKTKYQNRDPQLETSGKIVGFYEREFYCFSNFSSFAVQWRGRLWQTSEHAYQAAHFLKTAPKLVEKIYKAMSADEAKRIASANKDKFPSDWADKKIAIMEDIVRHKLKQNPYVMHKLLQTGKRKIIEDSPKDDFWGWGKKRNGRNELGKIWMKLRGEIIK
ncbi:MAG: NADAR family protein [Candidatus Pacebacteria bacterium]|nr:NADAR family protein [Candidatus Paceibacterota bacterium]